MTQHTTTTLPKGKHDLRTLQRILLSRGELIPEGVAETKAERKFIELMERHNIKVIPQWRINEYRFDFRVSERPILVEIDGSVHKIRPQQRRDYRKDRLAARRGFLVLRYTNAEVNEAYQGGGYESQFIGEFRLNVEKTPKVPREVLVVEREVSPVELLRRWWRSLLKKGVGDEQRKQ